MGLCTDTHSFFGGGDLRGMKLWDSFCKGKLDFKIALRNYIVQTLNKIPVEIGWEGIQWCFDCGSESWADRVRQNL